MDMNQTRSLIAALASPVALVATGALIYQASYAAFTATTDSTGSWKSANLAIDTEASLPFNATNIAPGYTETQCITVTPTPASASTVRMYAQEPETPNPAGGLADHVELTIEQVEGPSTEEKPCESLDLVTDAVHPEDGLNQPLSAWIEDSGAWDADLVAAAEIDLAANSTTRIYYRIVAEFDPPVGTGTGYITQKVLDDLQDTSAGITLVWERRSYTPTP